ncbi:peptidase M16 family protein [Cavenderia fasciculata]|uniref:Peptidase M16 family protein n=1 Tax=Cavenderia fasciculata TaxID=261658 RepID=F4PP19_CACFS|nr:peptidase M16 family protein [Cavenderia fasciculata]EGG22132.1 peptidase M16 family protein [Cavenderia fasciculata]|eukprot:XP_004359983.1 peptidase M16 family protein [Cavenderia fasciculata]
MLSRLVVKKPFVRSVCAHSSSPYQFNRHHHHHHTLDRFLETGIILDQYIIYSSFIESKRVAELTTLENGMKVVSLSGGFTGPAAALGIFVNTGSRFESQTNAGSNQVLKNLAFQSNESKIYLQVQREIAEIGSTAFAQISRDNLLISSEVLPPFSKQMLTSLSNITNPKLAYHEVRDCTEQTIEESESLEHCPVTQVFESLHKQAYRGRTLGRPLVAPVCNLGSLATEQVVDVANSAFTPSNLTLVGVGLNHKDLVKEAQQLKFGKTNGGAANKGESAKYVGGDEITYVTGNNHIVLAFEGVSYKNTKDVAASAVLKAILGGGSIQPKTAPGNGKTSRLFTLLEKNQSSLVKTDSININYQDTGLFGVYAESTETSQVGQVIANLANEFATVAKSAVSAQELDRAKNIAKTTVLEQTDSRSGALEFVGKQALYNNAKVLTPEEFVQEINSVTAEDIKRVASKMLQSRPTLIVRGNIQDVPTLDQVQSLTKFF